jgi:cyclophilin family peptidyl-prolyl cis-trans isomerase
MAVIKRASTKQSTPVRLICAMTVTAFVLSIVVVLYRMDTGFRDVRNRHMRSKRTKNIFIQHVNKNTGSKNDSNGRENRQSNKEAMDKFDEQKSDEDNGSNYDRNGSNYDRNGNNYNNDEESTKTAVKKEAVSKIEEQEDENYSIRLDEGSHDKSDRNFYEIELANLVENDSSTGNSGTIIIETRPDWGPIGAEHLTKLLDEQFYVYCRFFRVIPNFMVQFGINGDPMVQRRWKKSSLKDDVYNKQTNSRGTISFATSGKDTRTTQLFINTRTKGNAYLDDQGFTPVGQVLRGMNYIDAIYSEDREKPNQNQIQMNGNTYLQKEFPNLSYISQIKKLNPNDDRLRPEIGKGTEG